MYTKESVILEGGKLKLEGGMSSGAPHPQHENQVKHYDKSTLHTHSTSHWVERTAKLH